MVEGDGGNESGGRRVRARVGVTVVVGTHGIFDSVQ